MKKVSIISACTDLGLKIDGAELGAQVLTNDLKSSNISHNYVLKGNKKDEERIHNKCQQDSNGTHQHFLHKGGTLPLGDTHKRFSCSFAHHLPSFCTRLVMRRPTSSLVVVRASSMPLALPPHSTRMRSHSSSRTSRSSPT